MEIRCIYVRKDIVYNKGNCSLGVMYYAHVNQIYPNRWIWDFDSQLPYIEAKAIGSKRRYTIWDHTGKPTVLGVIRNMDTYWVTVDQLKKLPQTEDVQVLAMKLLLGV